MKRALVIGTVIVLVVGLMVAFGPLFINRRCQEWYHRVDFITDKRFSEEFGHRPRRSDYRKMNGPVYRLRAEVIEEIGAKPFYCN